MFGSDEKSLKQTLAYLVQEKHNVCHGNQREAAEQMAEVVAGDARFAKYDPVKLIARVQYCGGSGAQLDLDDPALMRGGSPRPLSDERWR
jgi:hypothetical protein